MEQLICPLDGKPCEKDCPDRYIDHPSGGCFLTTAQEMGAKIIDLGGRPTQKIMVNPLEQK